MKPRKKAKLLALIPIMFFSVSGGPYGLEEIVASVGPLCTLMLITLIPLVWTIPECLIVAELSSNYPVQGGYYRWVYMGLGRFWGFMEGWWSILYTIIDLSLYPILFTAYLKFFFPDLSFIQFYIIQLTVIWISALFNILGIRTVGYVLGLFTSFILISFLFFIVFGMKYLSFDFSPILNARNHLTGNNVLYGLSLAFWNFIGWDNSSTVLDEVHNPNHNYRRSMFINVPIIVFFYFFTLIVALSINTSWGNWTFGEFSRISIIMGHPVLAVVLTIGGMAMCLGLFNSLMLSSTRIFSTMADDNLLPSMFSKIHNKFQTPYIAIIFVSVLYSFLVLVDFKNLVVYDVFLYLIAISLEAIALIILRKKIPEDGLHFQIPFGKTGFWLSIVMLFACIILVTIANAVSIISPLKGTVFGLLLAFSGVPAYFFFLNRRKIPLIIKKVSK